MTGEFLFCFNCVPNNEQRWKQVFAFFHVPSSYHLSSNYYGDFYGYVMCYNNACLRKLFVYLYTEYQLFEEMLEWRETMLIVWWYFSNCAWQKKMQLNNQFYYAFHFRACFKYLIHDFLKKEKKKASDTCV